MKKQIIDSDNERIYVLEDDLISENIHGFQDELLEFIKTTEKNVILDLIEVTKIDSMSIALILRIKNNLVHHNRIFKLINPNESVLRILELAGLNEFLLD